MNKIVSIDTFSGIYSKKIGVDLDELSIWTIIGISDPKNRHVSTPSIWYMYQLIVFSWTEMNDVYINEIKLK